MSFSPGWPADTGGLAGILVGLLVVLAWCALPPAGPAGPARLARIAVDNCARPRGRNRAAARHEPDDLAVAATVATALDVLAACLYSGAPLEQALRSVADAFDDPVAGVLGSVARHTALGAPVETAWAVALADPQWAVAGRAIVRAQYSGAPLTDVLSRTADERRRALRATAEASAGRAGVRAVLPLGICFLPAFVLVGIVPVIAGFAASLWG